MRSLSLLLALGWLCLGSTARAEVALDYPISNPFEATIAGTPAALMPQLPSSRDIQQKDFSLNLRPQRAARLPGNFWAVKRLHYRLAWHKQPAPLMFLVAGTGARYDAASMEYLKKLFYGAGFHVVQLSSPTSYDFMVGASRYATPGFSPLDASELYQLMQSIRQRHNQVQVTSHHLAGYSLGGLHAAFIGQQDQQQQALNFQRVLLINPPVNLHTSVSNLDRMAHVYLADVDQQHDFYQSILERLARFFESRGRFDLNEAVLFEFQRSPQGLNNQQLAMLIASMFRLTAADISFTSDLINRRGHIAPPGRWLGDGHSLTPYFEQALKCDFNCYLREQLLPFWQQHYQPQGDLQQLVAATSLHAVQDYLRESPGVHAFHNLDDIILGAGDLDWLQQQLGTRLHLYPHGGHLGNMMHSAFADDLLEALHD